MAVIGLPALPPGADRPPAHLLRCRACVDHATPPVKVWERRTGAALAALPGAPAYRRREPERTLLHAVVRDRLEPFLAACRDRSSSGRDLPAHVERDLRAYLDCRILARGFAIGLPAPARRPSSGHHASLPRCPR